MKFREMRRAKQALSPEETLAVLKSAKRGVLSMIGDFGAAVQIFALVPEHITGKRVHEA